MANLNNYILTFIKISVITVLIFGGLLAQSYATNLVTDSIIQMNVEFSDDETANANHQTASIAVQNNQQSSFTFGNHQFDIKTIFVELGEGMAEEQQILAEVQIKQLGELGDIELIGSPSFLILRNKWAELKLNSEDGQGDIEFKIQYEGHDEASHNNHTTSG